jgi:hypothetical protein
MAKALELHVLAALIRNLHPHIDDLWGPELPNVRMRQNMVSAVALNPQPLPPIRPRIHNVAAMVTGTMFETLRMVEYQGKEQQQIAHKRIVQQLDDLVEWCGTVPASEKLRELLKKLGLPFPPIPDPEPHPDWTSVVAAAALFADAAMIVSQPALADAFNNAANLALDVGLKMSGIA